MSSAVKRLRAEARDLAKNGQDSTIYLEMDEDQPDTWHAEVLGPSDTPYSGGKFVLLIKCKPSYPIEPPSVTFLTKTFHPNVHAKSGELCLDILKAEWSPMWTLQSVCRAVIALFHSPNPDSPLNCDAGNLIRTNDLRGFNSMAKMYTIEYAQEGYQRKIH